MIDSLITRGRSPLLEAIEVRKRYTINSQWTRLTAVAALDGVSVQAWQGKTLAIAGESGCGKSTLGRLLLGLTPPDGGEVRFAGQPLAALLQSARRDFRGSVQMVFQNPMTSFNPMLTLGAAIADAMRLRTDLSSGKSKAGEAKRLGAQVGLDASFLKCYPSEVSAGQLQRAGIARALATRPQMIFLDEPTSALDVSGRRQIVNLLLSLQSELGLGYILVSHDFHVIRAMAHRLVIMYLGQVVEEGEAGDVIRSPLHPYSRALLAASEFGSAQRSEWFIRGEVSQLPAGYHACKLYSRCPHAASGCEDSQTFETVRPHQSVRCWKALEIDKMPPKEQ